MGLSIVFPAAVGGLEMMEEETAVQPAAQTSSEEVTPESEITDDRNPLPSVAQTLLLPLICYS